MIDLVNKSDHQIFILALPLRCKDLGCFHVKTKQTNPQKLAELEWLPLLKLYEKVFTFAARLAVCWSNKPVFFLASCRTAFFCILLIFKVFFIFFLKYIQYYLVEFYCYAFIIVILWRQRSFYFETQHCNRMFQVFHRWSVCTVFVLRRRHTLI